MDSFEGLRSRVDALRVATEERFAAVETTINHLTARLDAGTVRGRNGVELFREKPRNSDKASLEAGAQILNWIANGKSQHSE